jgi:hypothetical protein
VEKIESKGRNDELISAESWRRYLLRNDSELVDLCFGQLRSHVTCVGCGYESVTFDEFSSLSLPIPMKKTQNLTVVVYPLPLGSRPFKVSLNTKIGVSVSEFLGLLSRDPLFRIAVSTRKSTELGKRKKTEINNEGDSSYVIVDSDHCDDDDSAEKGTGNRRDQQISSSSSCSEIENLGEISIETDSEDTMVVVNNKVGGPNSSGLHFFHVCSLSTTYENVRIQKTYDEKGDMRDASDSIIVAYEMEQQVPTDKFSHGRCTSSYYSSSSSRQRDAPSHSYFDLLVGTKKVAPVRTGYTSTYHGMNPSYTGGTYVRDMGFKTDGYPIRIVYEDGKTTNEEMNTIIFEAVKEAYDLPEVYSPSRLPYTIHTTSSFANTSKGVVNLINEKSSDAFQVAYYDCLICCWNKDALPCDDDSSDEDVEAADNSEKMLACADNNEVASVDPTLMKRWLEDGINGTSKGKSDDSLGKNKQIGVLDCFNKFIEREQMPPEETWYCPNCKQHLAPIKKFDIWSAPEILVIHLKRFQYCSRAHFTIREKVNDLIAFPIEGLDLSSYVKSALSSNEQNPAIYDLYGVSEHSGNMGGGHYTAKCKSAVDNKWYSFNDSHVSECSDESAISSEAYVLFYKRRHGSLRWGGLKPAAKPLEK